MWNLIFAKLALTDVIDRVNRAGYGVATGEADLVIKRLSDDNDARRLEKALAVSKVFSKRR